MTTKKIPFLINDLNLCYRDAMGIFIASVFLFTCGLYSQEIIGFESRFYLFALEMWRHGVSWFPTTYRQPYPDYPVTSTLLIYSVSCLFGSLNKLTAVLPSALASAATVAITYLIGATYSRLWGWASAFFLLFTLGFLSEARTISLDQYVTLVTVMCFYFGVMNSVSFWAIALLLVLGFAFRGPIGIVIPTGVMCIGLLLDKKIKRSFAIGFVALTVLIVCSVILLLMAYHVGGVPFVQDVLRMEVAGRMQDANRVPFLFYFKESIGAYAITYPLAIGILIGCSPQVRYLKVSPEMKLVKKCLGWTLVIIIGLSMPADKKIRYILSMAPALALICGYLYVAWKDNRYLSFLYYLVYGFCCLFPIISLVLLLFLSKQKGLPEIDYTMLSLILVAIQFFIIYLRKQAIAVLGFAAITFVVVNIFVVEVVNLNLNKTRDFVLRIEILRGKYQTPLVFFREGPDGLPIKYLSNMSQESMPVYLYEPDQLAKLKPYTFVILQKENMPYVTKNIMQQFNKVMQGNIGHNEIVVLSKTSE